MIHRIEVTADTEPAELRKLFRKRLMTGGAVIRLQDGLSELELTKIIERFLPDVEPHNVSSMVLKEIKSLNNLPQRVKERLEGTCF